MKFVTARPLNWYRPSTSPISAPRTVAMIDAGIATRIDVRTDSFSAGMANMSRHHFVVQHVNSAICRSPRRSLNENKIMMKTGNAR